MSASGAEIEVVVVHWNRPAQCERSVRSFLAQTVPARVVVWENGSPPDVREDLVRRLGGLPRLAIEWSEENLGFAGAAAASLERWAASPREMIGVVSAHDVAAAPDALAEMSRALLEHESRGVVFGLDGEARQGRWGKWKGARVRAVAPGSVPEGGTLEGLFFHSPCWAVRQDAVRRGLGVDPRLFAYGEECDLGLSARGAGFSAALATAARVTSMEAGGSAGSGPLVDYLTARNSVLLAAKYGGRLAALWRAVRLAAPAVLRAAGSRSPVRRRAARWRQRGAREGLQGRFGAPPLELFAVSGESLQSCSTSGTHRAF